MNWKNITLWQFQSADEINSMVDKDELDKVLYTTCIVCNLTESQLDNMKPHKAAKFINKVTKIFSSELKVVAKKRIGKYCIEYNMEKITFGQYVELCFFLNGNNIKNAHYVIASISHLPFLKNSSKHHKKRADYFLGKSIIYVLGSMQKFKEGFEKFNAEYKSLFGLSDEKSDDETDKFYLRYGWEYSAHEVDKDLGLTLAGAYALPVREALGCLAYLKEKGKFEERQLKRVQAKTK